MDTSIPPGTPPEIIKKLNILIEDYHEGYITEKGYIKSRVHLLSQTQLSPQSTNIGSPQSSHFGAFSRPTSIAFTNQYPGDIHGTISDENSYSLQYHQRNYSMNSGFIKGFPIEGKKMARDTPQRSSKKQFQRPLRPRVINSTPTDAASFESLASILRQRAVVYQREVAILIVDSKGKDSVSITWEKLYLRAEKIAQQIKHKSRLSKNDRVCLVYRMSEVIDFTISLFGCFLAGVVAVPISSSVKITKMIKIMQATQSRLCLVSENVQKDFEKKLHDSPSLKWPKGLEFWKTTDMGTYHVTKKKDPPALQIPDIAYIEFKKHSDDEWHGVAVSHQTLMRQMNMLSSILSSNPNYERKPFKRRTTSMDKHRNIMLNILDARESVGLIAGTLLTVYSGNMMVWSSVHLFDIAGLYANVITRLNVTVLLNAYLGLKQVVFNYQSFPKNTLKFSKTPPDFSKLKWVLTHTCVVDGLFHETLANRWLKPLGCKNVENVVTPILTLDKFGGMIISMRDWLGLEDNLGAIIYPQPMDEEERTGNPTFLSEVLIDKQSLVTNKVKVVSERPPPLLDNSTGSSYWRTSSFGYPIPDAALAIVDPETQILSRALEVGEIWIDSPSLPRDIWGSFSEAANLSPARCCDDEGVLDSEFLRTGLLGFTFNGKVYVLGLYEDRLRQSTPTNHLPNSPNDYGPSLCKYYHSNHIAFTLARATPHKRVSDSAAFDVTFNGNHIPVIVIETEAAKSMPGEKPDEVELDSIATGCLRVLERYHGLHPYCLMILKPRSLPKSAKNGFPGISSSSSKRLFLNGYLKSVYVKFNIKKAIMDVPRFGCYQDSIWSAYVSNQRHEGLLDAPDQHSGLDYRTDAIDNRTKKPLTDFSNILDIFKWRLKHQCDELAFSIICKVKVIQLSWRRFEAKVAGIVGMILEKMKKAKLNPGEIVGLMYTLSDDFSAALLACWLTCLVPVPLSATDPNNVEAEIKILTNVIKDYNISNIFINSDVETLLKGKLIHQSFKENLILSNVKIRNTSKLGSQKGSLGPYLSAIDKMASKMKLTNDTVCLILLYFSEDNERTGVGLSMKNISDLCKIFKETCQLESKYPLIACPRHTNGIGFLQSGLIGIYIGASTYLLPPMEYATNPQLFFLSLSKYRVKNVFVTPQMLYYAMESNIDKNFSLEGVRDLIVGCEERPNPRLIRAFAASFSATKLNPSAISHVYCHPFNPMITIRSHLSFDPIDFFIDGSKLRIGLISLVHPSHPHSIHLQDSGIVSVCTEVVIVNPETRTLCKVGEFGEIWVCSEGNVQKPVDKGYFDQTFQFGAKIAGGNDALSYIRTGDFGFLHPHQRMEKNGLVDYQSLFVLGPIANTFECMGFMHFAVDIENSIESSHQDIRIGGSCVFKIDGYVVAIVDTIKEEFCSSLVPVIFNKVLEKHGLILDIVGFTEKGCFPYGRLRMKQRATIIKQYSGNSLRMKEKYGVNYGEGDLIDFVKRMEDGEKCSTPSMG